MILPDRMGWLRISVYVLVAGLALYGLGWLAGHRGARDAETLRQAETVLAIGRSWRARQDAFRRVAARERDAAYAAGARRAIHDSVHRADSARMASQVARAAEAPLDSAIARTPLRREGLNRFATDSGGARMIATTYAERDGLRLTIGHDAAALADARLEADHWQAADRADSARADAAEARVATLETNLKAVLSVHGCRIVFLPCPSRTVVGLLGIAAGFAAGKL